MSKPKGPKPALAVLAAGIGSRYGGMKQIETVGPSGEVVIDYSVFDAIEAGFGRLVIVIRRDIEETFKAVIEPHFAGRIPHTYVYQELSDVPDGFAAPTDRAKPWGTAHAVYACRHEIKEPFGVINADDFYGKASFKVLADKLRQFSAADNRYCMAAFVLRNSLSDHGPVSRGVCRVGGDGLLEDVTEHQQIERAGSGARCLLEKKPLTLTGDEPVSMNLFGFTPTFFDHLEREFRGFLPAGLKNPKAEFQLPTVVDTVIHQKRATVEVVMSPERWLGVTYPEDKPLVAAGIRALIDRGVYPADLWGKAR